MDAGLAGARVLVTGASGGIGAACARAFAAEGAEVVVHFHHGRDRAETLAAEIRATLVLGADLTDEDETDALFAAAGPLDVCAAVAGVRRPTAVPVSELSAADFRATVDANLTATFLTARGFLRGLAGRERGSLVLVGSTAGLVGEEGHGDYAAAKSAITGGLLLTLKNEAVRIAPGARVNAVSPGWTATPARRDGIDAETVRRVTRTMPLRKLATPEGVAAQVVVLASDRLSGHVTGQTVVVAGGMEGRVLHP